ncbi:sugar phosphate permease [Halohasta litchfieldiae]|jgi:MFS family permease|uniref:Sugar phosphate permease n=1 Tax=Halohasta litchfieldiae TaxID=1073996 RepID=A0A1H6V5E4_9EURY|nr:MFS transporter [Halohasta litchfieldiae]ATW87493.1 sugar phosphate permease [Halohasta litchfieldiae]SEI99741.1 Sugar phosphate permease [Halohasta litchfieldiae]
MSLSLSRPSLGSVRRFLRTYDLVFLVAFLWFMVQFLRFIFPPLFGTFQDVYGVSNTQTGLLFTLLMFGYSAMQFPGGWLGDRFHEVSVMAGGALLFALAAVFAGFAPTFTLIMVAAVGIGIGTGIHKTVAIAYLSRVYPERTGLSLGIMDTIGQFGGMLAPIVVVGLLASVLPWESVFFIGAAVSVVLAAALFYRAHPNKGYERRDQQGAVDHPPDDDVDQPTSETPDTSSETETVDDPDDATSYLAIFSDRKILLFLAVTMLFTFSWNGLSAFFPLFLADEKGLSPSVAGIAYSLLFAASVSQTVTGGASDRVGKLAISLLLFGVMIGGLIALLVTDSVVLILGLTVITGIGFHGFRPVRDSYLMDLIPPEIGGGTLGIVRTGMTAIGGVAPVVIGYLSDVFGFVVAFGLIVCVLACGGLLIVVLR